MIVLWCLGWLHGAVQALRERHRPRPHTAWTGPWPPGCLPISVVLGDHPAEWVGYVEVPAGGEPDLAGFWRLHADALDRARERSPDRPVRPGHEHMACHVARGVRRVA